MSLIEHRERARRADARQRNAVAERAAQIVARYEPLVRSVAAACVLDRVLASAIAQEALVAVLLMPENDRTAARVIEATRKIATDNACRFAAYAQ